MSGTNDDLGFTAPEDPLGEALRRGGIEDEAIVEEVGPVYKVRGDSKIAVSKHRGKGWKARRDSARKSMSDLISAWDEAIRYYNHDQQGHRDGTDSADYSGNRFTARRLNEKHSITENIVYSNVNAQIPELYAKNPEISVTAGPNTDEEEWEQHSQFARALEKLVNVLFSMRLRPGVNMKPKAKRAIVVALLTNRCWFESGYVNKDMSSDSAQSDLIRLSQELVEAKDEQRIREIEGELFALEERVEFLQPSGPTVHLRLPHQVIVDPDHNDPWLTDANWVMVEDMLPTDYINAVYGRRQAEMDGEQVGDRGKVMSIYEPTHVLDGGGDGESDTFSLFDDTRNDYSAYGFTDKETFNKAKRTKVWRVWDKVTRRLELYSDKDWSWPIWVWDDPYQLDTFFPLTPLWFHENPVGVYAKGEVSFYLDQQDVLNEINDEQRRSLLWARRNLFFDETVVTSAEVEKILSGGGPTATGLKVPEGKDPTKLVFTLTPPSMNWQGLFDKRPIYDAIDRISASNDVMRGEQFKTNTTNRAIDYYSTLGNMRMDERLDAVEDAIGDVGWKLAQLCLRFMPADVVTQLIGMDVTAMWTPLDNMKDYGRFNMTIVGGSTQKLTGAAKKQHAVQVGQVLSQFARAAPLSVLKTTLRMFSRAFDDVIIREEDWDAIAMEVAGMAGGAPQAGGVPGGGGGSSGMGGPGVPGGGGAGPEQMVAQVVQLFEQMPPQLQQAIGLMLARGVPPAAIAQHLMQQMQGQQAGATQ